MLLLSFLARRFVAGEHPVAAVAVGRRLKTNGILSTFDRLGEDVRDPEAARRTCEAIQELLRLLPEGLERNVSIKLSSLGQQISRDLCIENAVRILDTAREVGGFVRIDMEGSKTTDSTLGLFRTLRLTHDNVGIVLQAYLHRTEEDVKESVRHGDRVRLCKGAYKEPPAIAWRDMDAIRENFRLCARLLLAGEHVPAIATHDESLIAWTQEYCAERGIAPSAFEFQMLLGLRPKRWATLAAAGHRVRIYVPYGTHWLPYFTRRLRERRQNVAFVIRHLIGG